MKFVRLNLTKIHLYVVSGAPGCIIVHMYIVVTKKFWFCEVG